MILLLALLATCLAENRDDWGPDGKLPLQAEVVASGLTVPWSFAFLPGGDVLVSERPGRVRLMHQGKIADAPVLQIKTGETSEGGVLGIAVDPKDPTRLFVYVTVPGPSNEVQRWRLTADHAYAQREEVVVSGIAASPFHNGGRLRFGPDGALYIGTGDARKPERSQDSQSLNGKLLKLDAKGHAEVVLKGIRNLEAFDWLDNHTLVLADHGPSGELGRYASDELDVAHPGENLGWPDIYQCETKAGMVTPLLTFPMHALPPGGIAVYRGTAIPQLRGSVLIASLGAEQLHRVVLNGDSVQLHEVYFRQKFGRLRELSMTPNGELWVTTSNCDGRGECPPERDKILRIVTR